MTYNMNKTNGSKLTTVDDGAINNTACDLTLVGKKLCRLRTICKR